MKRVILALAFILAGVPPAFAYDTGIIVDVAFTTEIPGTANAYQVGQLFMTKLQDAQDRIVVPDWGQGYNTKRFLKTLNKTTLVRQTYQTVTTDCGFNGQSQKAFPIRLEFTAEVFSTADPDRYRVRLAVDRLDGTVMVNKNGCRVTEPNVRRRVATMTVAAPGKKINLRFPLNGKVVTIRTVQVGKID